MPRTRLLSTSARHLSRRLLLSAHRHGPETAYRHCPGLPAHALWVLAGDEAGWMAAAVRVGGHADICHDCDAAPELVGICQAKLDLQVAEINISNGFAP